MKKIFVFMMLFPILSFAQTVKNDREFSIYLNDYAKESAKYQICGEYDRADIANIGIYFDEIVSPNYLKQQIRKYGSQDKAARAAMKRAQTLADKYQHRLVKNGVPSGMCAKLLSE